MTTRKIDHLGQKFAAAITLLAIVILLVYWVSVSPENFYRLSAVTFLVVSIFSLVGVLFSNWYSLYLIHLFRQHAGPDPQPACQFSAEDLPFVTIQLPMYNEANVAERLIRSAAAVDYPGDKLQIQVIDDSSDETTEIIQAVFEDLQETYPQIEFQHLRRPTREAWKAGGLNYGLDRAKGELLAIFDADFIISKDFLQRTVHFFTERKVGLVQGRWAFINRRYSVLTGTQASKLDAHQVFEQTARYRAGYWVFFHGTAGIWRRTTIESSGRWSAVTDVEDAELSIRALLNNWQFVYLNDLKLMSELPVSMGAYLTQQRRWKRGWIKIFQMYAWKIIRSKASLRVRLDVFIRLANMMTTLLSLIVSTGALPAFMVAKQLGLSGVIFVLYTLLLITSLTLRIYESRTVESLTKEPVSTPNNFNIVKFLKQQFPFRLLLDMGTLWTWTVGTFDVWMGKSGFERTPKFNIVDSASNIPVQRTSATLKFPRVYMSKTRSLQFGTLFLGGVTATCIYQAALTAHWMSILFYVLQLAGICWVSGSLFSEQRA